MKILIIANGTPPTRALIKELLPQHTAVVAVDGGLHTCFALGVEPNLVIGDFDSLSEKMRHSCAHISQIHVPNQNKTDLQKTLDYLESWSAEKITICGALGLRVDHMMTNICLLCRYPGKVYFETEMETCFALEKNTHFSCKSGQTISLLPGLSPVKGVTTQGLKWELNGENIDNNFVSISNICEEQSVSISIEEGVIIACLIRNVNTLGEGRNHSEKRRNS